MSTYSKTIGVSGTETGIGTHSLNLTMASDEYPTTVQWGSVSIYVPVSAGASIGFSLCNTSGGNSITLMSDTYYPQGTSSIGSGSKTVSGTGLKGQALAIYTKFLNSATFNNTWSFTITTNYATYKITITNSTGGTVTASATSGIRSGTTITLYRSASTGYQFSSWGTSVTVNSSNQFTMPAANVTVNPTWTKINYAITKAVNPSGAGTLTAPSTATYGATVTLSQTPASTTYAFSHYGVSSIGTLSGNTFTMPASAVTVTAYYTETSHTITWTNANLEITQNGRFLTFKKTGTAISNHGEPIHYELHKNGESIGQFKGDTIVHKLINDDKGKKRYYELIAVADTKQELGYSADYTANFTIPTSDDCGYYTDDNVFVYAVPLYYNGSNWKECEIKYRYNNQWNLITTFF